MSEAVNVTYALPTPVTVQATVAGTPGQGVPAGGTTGQSLVKSSNDDYDTEWATVEGGGVTTLTVTADDDTVHRIICQKNPTSGLYVLTVEQAEYTP